MRKMRWLGMRLLLDKAGRVQRACTRDDKCNDVGNLRSLVREEMEGLEMPTFSVRDSILISECGLRQKQKHQDTENPACSRLFTWGC